LIYLAPYYPQTIAQIEQSNGTLKQMIQIEQRAYLSSTYAKILPLVLEKYNMWKYSMTNMAPLFIETKDLNIMKDQHAFLILATEPSNWKEKVDTIVLDCLKRATNKAIACHSKKHTIYFFVLGKNVLICAKNYKC
jgi:hypothetical protein